MSITYNRLPHLMGGNEDRTSSIYRAIDSKLKELSTFKEFSNILVYSFGGEYDSFTKKKGETNEKTVRVYFSCSHNEKNEKVTEEKEIQTRLCKVLSKSALENVINIEIDGVTVMQYFKDLKEFFILIDLSGNEHFASGTTYDLISRILNMAFESFITKYRIEKLKETSWENESSRNKIIENLRTQVTKEKTSTLLYEKERIDNFQRAINERISELKQNHANLEIAMKKYSALSNMDAEIDSKIVKELDLIYNHEQVTFLSVTETELTFKTVHLNIYTPKKVYLGREYLIQIDFNQAKLKIFSVDGTGRKGLWSMNDPHPHVSSSGNPCLGNLAETLALLCNQKEFYAVAMMAIDFCQSVNTDDSAGMKVLEYPEYVPPVEDVEEVKTPAKKKAPAKKKVAPQPVVEPVEEIELEDVVPVALNVDAGRPTVVVRDTLGRFAPIPFTAEEIQNRVDGMIDVTPIVALNELFGEPIAQVIQPQEVRQTVICEHCEDEIDIEDAYYAFVPNADGSYEREVTLCEDCYDSETEQDEQGNNTY